MNTRQRLKAALSGRANVAPPRYESEFSAEVSRGWREQGVIEDESPESVFELDEREEAPVNWRRFPEERHVVTTPEGLEAFRRQYEPAVEGRLPSDWEERLSGWGNRDHALFAMPWSEGFFQVLGVTDGRTLDTALATLCEKPRLVDALMDHYAGFLEGLLNEVLEHLDIDLAVLRDPIASNHGPVISPAMYERFVVPALQRVNQCLERHNVAHRFLWTAGQVRALIPLWLDAGINGLMLNHCGHVGIRYTDLQREFGSGLLLEGGIDSRAVVEGPEAIDRVLEHDVRPLLAQGGYLPHLDDTIREYIPYEHFRYYREALDAMMAEVSSS